MKKLKASQLPTLVLVFAIGVASAFMPSCYPNGPESPEDFDVTITTFDDDTDFTTFKTYSLPDSIPLVPNPEDPGEPVTQPPLSGPTTQLILSTIDSMMAVYGWTKELDPNNNPPDITMVVGVSATENYGAYVSYDWYNYYGGWYVGWGGYGSGWGIGYSWYPSTSYYTQTYSFSVGTLIMGMLDLENPDTDKMEVNAPWLGALNGLMSGTNTDQRLHDGIVQAFVQSPYLNLNDQ